MKKRIFNYFDKISSTSREINDCSVDLCEGLHKQQKIDNTDNAYQNMLAMPSKISKLKNGFDVLMENSKASNAQILYYSLMLNDNFLDANFIFSREALNNNFKTNSVWSATINISNNSSSRKDIVQINNYKLRLITNIKSNNIQNNDNIQFNNSIHYISILKSMVQKAARRRNMSAVVRLSIELSKNDLTEFFRRIPIIILEDCLLHPAYPIIIWLMIAVSKGYQPPLFLTAYCIAIIAETTTIDIRDSIDIYYNLMPGMISKRTTNESEVRDDRTSNHSQSHSISPQANASEETSLDTNAAPVSEPVPSTYDIDISKLQEFAPGYNRTLVASILLRCSYGGMHGDVILLQRAASVWAYRLLRDPAQASIHSWRHREGQAVDYQSINYCPGGHCCGYIHPLYISSLNSTQWGQSLLDIYHSVAPSTTKFDEASIQRTDAKSMKSELEVLHDIIRVQYQINIDLNENSDILNNNLLVEVMEEKKNISNVIHLSTSLPVRAEDWLLEGIDFHCDKKLIPFILNYCQEYKIEINRNQSMHYNLEKDIQNVIWLFRSSFNNHKIWLPSYLADLNMVKARIQTKLQSDVNEKTKLSYLWKVVCPIIALYTRQCVTEMIRQYQLTSSS